jgi:hypothetical protein
MDKNFSEVSVGGRFTLNSLEFIKTETVRVSCCQSINAQAVNDPSNRIFVQDSTVVTINA